jgi:hypothetical protein
MAAPLNGFGAKPLEMGKEEANPSLQERRRRKAVSAIIRKRSFLNSGRFGGQATSSAPEARIIRTSRIIENESHGRPRVRRGSPHPSVPQLRVQRRVFDLPVL